jgi:predicted metal-dependent hydrolase
MSLQSLGTQMLRVDAREVPVELALHPRARRITLRVDKVRGTLRLTLPPGVSQSEGLRFAGRQQAWLRRRLSELPQAVPFADGAQVPVLGELHTIRHVPGARRGVWREAGEIRVSGAAAHLPRRVRDYLKREARREIAQRAAPLARQVGRPHGRITLRDTASRWGSCSAKGDLSFSWRLIMAPERVLQYVVAHEVAHLRQMNHSPRFWALVDQLMDDVETPKAWLRRHGASLMRYG